MNREQRRKAAKQKNYEALPMEEKIARLYKHGIKPEDLAKEFDAGYRKGFQEASPSTFKACYAAFALALKRSGVENEQIYKFIRVVDDLILNEIDNFDAVQKVFEETGFRLDFGDPFERVQRNE